MPDFAEHHVLFGQTTLRFWTIGEAEAPWIVICHGGALDHAGFRPAAEALATEWRVLLWDLPGHGLSQPMPGGFSVALCADALSFVMDAAEIPRAVLLGFSFGGMVAQVFARARPERVAGFIAYACFAPLLVLAPVPVALIPVVTWGLFGRKSWTAIQQDFAARCSVSPAVRADAVRAMQPLGKRGFLAMTRALLTSFKLDPAFCLRTPLLIISGADDSNGTALRVSLAALKRAHPAADETVLQQAGHCAHQDRPEVFLAAIATFLRSLKQ